MRRRLAVLAAVLAFVAVSVVLARWLSAEGAERGRITDLLDAQARGDVPAMLAEIDGCASRPACVASIRRNASRLRSRGKVEIVAYESGTSRALRPAAGPTRVVWRAGARLPTVQCVLVRRKRGLLAGPSVSLTSLSDPIRRTAAC